MVFYYDSNHREFTLYVVIKTTAKQRIRIVVYDKTIPDCIYVNRFKDIFIEESFYIRMPLSPKRCTIEIYNEHIGRDKNVDKTFNVVKCDAIPLVTKFKAFDFSRNNAQEFVRFAERFSILCGKLSTQPEKGYNGHIYKSQLGNFTICYVERITDENGIVIPTPMRINKQTGMIEVSRERIRNFTVPRRVCTLFHEYAHLFVNNDLNNETEADLNAILMFLGLGFPRTECIEAFIEIFGYEDTRTGRKSDTVGNRKRFEIIKNFINKFEEQDFKLLNI